MPNTTDTRFPLDVTIDHDVIPIKGGVKATVTKFLDNFVKVTVYPNLQLMEQKVPPNVRIKVRREDLLDILSVDPEDAFGSDIVEMTLLDADVQADTPSDPRPQADTSCQDGTPCQEENCDSPLAWLARLGKALCQEENMETIFERSLDRFADALCQAENSKDDSCRAENSKDGPSQAENGKDDSDPFATPLDVESPLQQQIGGAHYKNCVIQPVEYCQHNGLNYCESNVVKYVTRHREKGGVEDLKKAKHYIDLLIAMEYGVDC